MNKETQYNVLLGEFIGTLSGILWWGIPDELKIKLEAKITELRLKDLQIPEPKSDGKFIEYYNSKENVK